MKRFSILAAVLLAAGPAAAGGAGLSAGYAAARGMLPKGTDGSAAAFRLQSRDHREALTDLLRDRDAEVRRAAVRALKDYVAQTTRTRDAVLDVYRNAGEELSVRYEAAKTLSAVNHYNEVSGALLDTARYGSEAALRAISYKALYTQASGHSRIRSGLEDAARRGDVKEVRLGAIWALFGASGNPRTRDLLEDIAFRDADVETRVEALKSLYLGMGHSRVSDRVRDLALDRSAGAAVRKPAILLLSAAVNRRNEDALAHLVRYESDAALREAAILAMSPGDDRLAEYFHLVRRTQPGGVIDPLDRE